MRIMRSSGGRDWGRELLFAFDFMRGHLGSAARAVKPDRVALCLGNDSWQSLPAPFLYMSLRPRRTVAADVRRRNLWEHVPLASSRRRLRAFERTAAYAAWAFERFSNTAIMLSKMSRPSALPSSGSQARSGWGINPATFRRSLQMPAMFSSDPLGFAVSVASLAA